MRGNRRDYDEWEKMGNLGWDWDSVLEYFKKSEDNTEKKYAEDIHYHAIGGLMKVGSFGSNDSMRQFIKQGYMELNLKEINVSNGETYLGYFDSQGTVDGGVRFGTAKAFLATAKGRKNLHIIKHAIVTNLIFDAEGSVNGVQFQLGFKKISAIAKKEVVISAGVVGSPHILMLSGIGPRAELEKHNINVKHNLPVGSNLQDHVVIPFAMIFDKSNSTVSTPIDLADKMYQYTVHRKGDLTNIGTDDLALFISTVNDPKYPDIQIHVLSFEKQDPGVKLMINMFNLNDKVAQSLIQANKEAKLIVWCVSLINPKSRGRIDLYSNSPFIAPKIYPNYLHDKADVDVIVKGIKMLNRFTETTAFSEHEGQVVHIDLPTCDQFEYQSNLYWECYVRHMTITGFHHVGTCKMGPLNEAATVVDSELKVKGVNGLRVVDASIMPKLVSGNTNAPTIMIGEIAADFIKDDWWGKAK